MKESLIDSTGKLHIFSGTSHPALAEEIAEYIGQEVCDATVKRFNNGEIRVMLGDNVRGKHVFVLQTFSHPVNEMIMELLVMIDAMKRASATSVTAVIPYYAYNRHDRKIHDRDPITAKLLANMISAAGADRIVSMDLHTGQLEGFFDIPVEHLFSEHVMTPYIKKFFGDYNDSFVVVSPDMAGTPRARHVAQLLDCPLVILDRRRPKPDVAVIVDIVGEVKGKNALLFDDVVDTAGSLVEGAKALKEAGAKGIYAACTHAVLSGDAIEQLESSYIEKIIVTDSIARRKEELSDKIKVVKIAPYLGEAILRIFKEQSIAKMYD